MILSKHYSTPPHDEEEQQSQKLMNQGPLDPKPWTGQPPHSNNVTYRIPPPPSSTSAQTHPSHYAYGSPSNSRRGSSVAIEPSNHTSPPSSPSHTLSRPSPFEHRPDLISTPSSPLHSPWRRDSLPSISQLTGEIPSQKQRPYFSPTPFHSATNHNQYPPQSNSITNYSTLARPRHTSSPANLLLEDAHMRRHSIAIATSSNHHNHPRHITAPKRDSVSYPSSTTSSTCSSPPHEAYTTPIFSPPPSALSSPARRHSNAHMLAPYSRSPELRVSHKLAERKRRKEMKDLFDDLRDLLPVDKGLKTSKWEILSKAVGYIHHLHEREQNFNKETEQLQREIMALKEQRQ